MEYIIKFIDFSEESLSEITEFLQETFPQNKKFTTDFIKWQYADNPLGTMVAFNAYDEGRIISHFAAQPISMNLYGQTRKGLLCMNVSTNKEYRGKRLFTILGEKTIDYAKNNGFDFMIAVPNANSTHAFLKYFGFYKIASLSAKVGFGKNIYLEGKYNCYRNWDEQQWEWRVKNPTNRYYCNKNGIISTPISFFAKTISKAEASVKKMLELPDVAFRPLNLYVGLGADTSKGLYMNIPSFVKRPPFNLVFRDFSGSIPTIKAEDVFLQLIDLDTI